MIFSIICAFQLFNEPSIMQNMVPGNAISPYYTPNMYAYNLSFAGNQSNYAAALAITMAVITMAIAYVVQINSMKEQMKCGPEGAARPDHGARGARETEDSIR